MKLTEVTLGDVIKDSDLKRNYYIVTHKLVTRDTTLGELLNAEMIAIEDDQHDNAEEKIVERFKEGASNKEVIEEFGISMSRLTKIKNKYGFADARKKINISFDIDVPLDSSEQKVFDLLKDGATYEKIMETLNIARSTVYNHIKSIERKQRNAKGDDIDKGKMMALLNAGWNIEEIADEFGTTSEAIIRVMNEQ